MHRDRTIRGWRRATPIVLALLPGAAPGQTPDRANPPPAIVADRPPGGPGKEGVEETSFGMSPAVVCSRVEGLGRFTPLPEATLTNADKLKVYFRPLRFKVATDAAAQAPYRAHFVEDGRIRRKGDKTILAKEDKLLEYDTRFATSDYQIYLVNTIGLEQLAPGDYELDITLHDMIDGVATARQTVAFRVVATEAQAAAAKNAAGPPTPTPSKSRKAAGAGRSSKRPG